MGEIPAGPDDEPKLGDGRTLVAVRHGETKSEVCVEQFYCQN